MDYSAKKEKVEPCPNCRTIMKETEDFCQIVENLERNYKRPITQKEKN